MPSRAISWYSTEYKLEKKRTGAGMHSENYSRRVRPGRRPRYANRLMVWR